MRARSRMKKRVFDPIPRADVAKSPELLEFLVTTLYGRIGSHRLRIAGAFGPQVKRRSKADRFWMNAPWSCG